MKVIAHRGASGNAPENTLSAIQLALEVQVDAIEIDTQIVDGQVILLHDRWLHKTTNGTGRIDDLSFAELRLLDAGKGQQIPTLWEVLQLVDGQCELNVELKGGHSAKPVIELLERAISVLSFEQEHFLLSSFNHHLLKEIKSMNKEWRVGALTSSLPLDYARFASDLFADSVHLDKDFIDQAFVDDAHQRGLKVYVYTVDQTEDLIELKRMGVDGVFTNYPSKIKSDLAG